MLPYKGRLDYESQSSEYSRPDRVGGSSLEGKMILHDIFLAFPKGAPVPGAQSMAHHSQRFQSISGIHRVRGYQDLGLRLSQRTNICGSRSCSDGWIFHVPVVRGGYQGLVCPNVPILCERKQKLQ